MSEPIDRQEAARRFRAAMDAAGITPTQAAMRLGIPPARVHEYRSGRRVPDWPRLLWMATTLGLDPTILAPEWFSGPAGA